MMPPSSHLLSARLTPPVTAITAYDYPMARLCDEAGVQLILVGDSLGMMVAGEADTTGVTLDQMAYHTRIVRNGVRRAIILSDLPINSYDTPEETVASAKILINAGADAVKLEGGLDQIEKIEALTKADIPFCGHIGMLPQRVREEGGYKKKGKGAEEAARLVESALAIEKAGAFAIILESMVADVAESITNQLLIPTIGIGAGDGCDGQVRVLHDVTGAYPWFVPPFATVHGDVAGEVSKAVEAFIDETSSGEKS